MKKDIKIKKLAGSKKKHIFVLLLITKTKTMKNYLTNLLLEKGITEDINFDMRVDGHINLTYKMQIDFICSADSATIKTIRDTFVKIDFMNGDVLDYWSHITRGMLASLNY